MQIALFITCSARTVQLECTVARVLRNIVITLWSDVFYSINVPTEGQVAVISEYMHRMCNGTSVRFKDVYVDRGKYNETHACRTVGRAQAEGMIRCMRILESSQRVYDYIIRTRTDLYVPFALHSLPLPHPHVAYVGFVGNSCNDGRAMWVDDRFAILPTTVVQRAYFYNYARDVCSNTCRDGTCKAPECKIGSALRSQRITPIDLRGVPKQMGLQIIRSSCISETQGKTWIRPSTLPPFPVTHNDLLRIHSHPR